MYYALSCILIALYVAVDALEQGIDHAKGAATLKDAWHLLRLAEKLLLLFVGTTAYLAIKTNGYTAILLTMFSIASKYAIWEPIYAKRWHFYLIDEQVKLPYVPFLSELLGFGKK